ncbi:lipopolysaccharide heptosyltransferase I [Pseudomonas sp. Choline-3u-10]|uniref:lipopolysaccharide heptosyltransferase I n=1 Tax=Pseudomonadaceae TaxID=135621 RepID=UPI000617C6FA|nr:MULTISPECIES: lipopolysaccharide heptosyltransferase I [unclassified Pseudomonas]MBK3793737.1 lipopolysaccharide heptosyltransferase I [Stutzerimonas stutzeri]MBU0949500.1 lipopolysaccharide heptosyltransferase I [Gammaproteobacteria bacterium]KJJ64739.1 ADP-heptose--LPS heptosyltransferase [Pseudomonas sp. 10B238]MBK3875227.1 lipopolysaccharide heptosyltransferase I [Stutzerimonas stutzeri]PKG94839.1 lipopolysaccharide heptosyltransferase I [Pseudomonas sp. Choline-3u-10]
MRVLLVKTSSLGDVIHTLPALTDAQRAIPGIQFDWVVEEGFAEIPAWHPAVAQVIPVAIRRWRKHPLQTLRTGEWRRFKARLRETHYDLVIDAQGLLKSAWLTRYVKAPVAGLDRDSIREPLASRFYDRRYAVPRERHALERVRQLFAQALGYSIPEMIADYGLDRSQLATPGEQPYLLFLHGTTWPSKHWPEAYWRQLAERMSEFGWAIRLPWGNAEEKARAERIAQGLPSASVLPRLNLGGVAKVVAGARACVAVDTGLGHLAAALDVPSISLYGPTLPGRVGAYGRSQVHLCAPGPNAGKGDRHKPCFDGLSAEHVASELKALLRSSETP